MSFLAAAVCAFMVITSTSAQTVAHQGSGPLVHIPNHPIGIGHLQLADPKAKSQHEINPHLRLTGGATGCTVIPYSGIVTGNELWGTSDTNCNGDTIEISVQNYWLFCSNYFAVCFNWVIVKNATRCIRQLASSVACPYYSDEYTAKPTSLWAYETNVCVTFLSGYTACGSSNAEVWT